MTKISLRLVLTVIGGALFAYAGFWYYMSQNAEEYLRGQTQKWSHSGFDLEFDGLEVSGFPYRLVIELDEPRVFYTNGLMTLRADPDDLNIVVQPWQFEHAILFSSGGRLSVATGQKAKNAGHYEYTNLGASARFLESQLTNLSIEAEKLSHSDGDPKVTLTSAQFHWRVTIPAVSAGSGLLEPAISEIAVSAGQITVPRNEGPEEVFDKLSIRITPRGPGGLSLDRTSLALWRDKGGTLEIDSLTVGWPDGGVNASGSFTLDEAMRPLGLMSMEITDGMDFVSRLGATGIFEKSTIEALENALRPGPCSSPLRSVSISLSWQTGQFYLESFQIAKIDPLFND